MPLSPICADQTAYVKILKRIVGWRMLHSIRQDMVERPWCKLKKPLENNKHIDKHPEKYKHWGGSPNMSMFFCRDFGTKSMALPVWAQGPRDIMVHRVLLGRIVTLSAGSISFLRAQNWSSVCSQGVGVLSPVVRISRAKSRISQDL